MPPDPDLESVLRLGCYFLFSIDPITTLEFLEDPEVIRTAKNMANKSYLAYASRVSQS